MALISHSNPSCGWCFSSSLCGATCLFLNKNIFVFEEYNYDHDKEKILIMLILISILIL